ncbi:MAG: DNA polymerase [Verrucomicrobiales bacterium]
MPEVIEKSAPRRAGRGVEEEVQLEQTLIPFEGNRTASQRARQASSEIAETGSYSATDPESGATIAIPAPFPDSPHEAVTTYRAQGLTPIPLNRFDEGAEGERGKKPRIKGYRDAAPELVTPDFIDKYWGNGAPANVGLVLRGPHVVIDLDSKEDAGASAEAWLVEHPELASIPCERTAGGLHLHFLCHDLPEFRNGSGKPRGKALSAKLNDKVIAELLFAGLPVTVTPSTHESGAQYRWRTGGELPAVSWDYLKGLFRFTETEGGGSSMEALELRRAALRDAQVSFQGDLRTLDIVKLAREADLYGECIDADEGKHSLLCPFHDEHSDGGQDWNPSDTATVVYEGRGENRPGFHCFHAHCDGRGLPEVLTRIEEANPGLVDRCCERSRIWVPGDPVPRIELPRLGRSQSEFAEDVASALAPTRKVFVHGEEIVEVRSSRQDDLTGGLKLHALSANEVVTGFERFIEFVKPKKEGEETHLVPASMTKPEVLLASHALREGLPRIDRILEVAVPVFHGGEIAAPEPGYDERLRTYLDPGSPVPVRMTFDEALEVIDDLIGNEDERGFAWNELESKVAGIARLVTPYCRGLMDWAKVPLFIFMANQPRVGKDTLANLVVVTYTGRETNAPPLKKEAEDEMRKRITSSLRAGAAFVHFPNMKGSIDFASLEAATDGSRVWRDRLLGGNRELVLPNEAEYSLSANLGASWSLDLDGRAVIIRLHYPGEDVNRREFRHPNILDYTRKNRARILGAVDALVRHWDEQGRPPGPTPHASFPRWAEVVGGVMHVAGLGDPCKRPEDLQGVTGDLETEDMRRLFRVGHEQHGNAFIGKEKLYELIRSSEEPIFGYLELDNRAGKTSLGKKLIKFRDRELSGVTLRINDSDKHRLRYAFLSDGERPGQQTLQTSQTSDSSPKSPGADEPGGDESDGSAVDRDKVCDLCEVQLQDAIYWRYIDDAEELTEWVAGLADGSGPVALDIETHGPGKDGALDPWKGSVRLIQLAQDEGEPVVIDVPAVGEAIHGMLDALAPHLLVGHNLAFDLAFLGRHFGFRAEAAFCTMTASKVLSAGDQSVRHRLKDVASRYLGIGLAKGLGDSDWSGPLTSEQLNYAALDVAHLLPLRSVLKAKLKEADLVSTAQLEMKMVLVATEMCLNGLRISIERLESIEADAVARQEKLREKIAVIAGPDLNPQSVPQVKEAFHQLGIDLPDTREETLNECDHELARAILDFRETKAPANKAKELTKLVAEDGRVHPEFDPLAARTGRFSASKPNVQNLPRGIMRQVIVAGPGRKLIAADYSQIELRAAAVLANEKRMLEAYRNEEDLHTTTASLVLGKPATEIISEERRLAKAVNFGLLYGQGASGFVRYAANTYGVTIKEAEAKQFRAAFFNAYPAIRDWHDRMRKAADGNESETRTRLGRRRLIPEETDWWPRFTTLVNTPVQGAATDGMKLALWALKEQLPASARLVSMIHDEVIVEVDESDAAKVLSLVKQVMAAAMANLLPEVPIEVDARIGDSWAVDEA